MKTSLTPELLTMDEGLFHRLLEGPGTVRIDIVRLDDYFAPFVTFLAGGGAPCVPHGAIVRGKTDLLAARTVDDLLDLLRDIAGGSSGLQINLPLHEGRDGRSRPDDCNSSDDQGVLISER